MNATAGDRLDPDRPVNVKFTIASRNGEPQVLASVTFQSDGLQMLAPGGMVSVNGVPLVAAALKKQGFWYSVPVPRSAQYQLTYTLGTGKSVQQRSIVERPFVPELPEAVSRGRGLVLRFSGAPLGPRESLFAEISGGGEGPGRWSRVLRASADGATIVGTASSLATAPLGMAKLYVGVVAREVSSSGDYVSIHTSGSDRAVTVTD